MIISTNIVNTNNDIHADNSNNYTISIIIIVIIIISIDNIIMDHIGRARVLIASTGLSTSPLAWLGLRCPQTAPASGIHKIGKVKKKTLQRK